MPVEVREVTGIRYADTPIPFISCKWMQRCINAIEGNQGHLADMRRNLNRILLIMWNPFDASPKQHRINGWW